MHEIVLKLKEIPKLYLDIEGIIPERIAGKKLSEIEELDIYHGKRKVKLADFFDISMSNKLGENPEEIKMVFEGELSKVKRIGYSLASGKILVKGNAGMYLGAFMKGGEIIVEGDVDSFAALNMKGGKLIIKGNCGDYLGASYRGEWRGMYGGEIIVEGNVGKELGAYMRKGKIVVKGNADMFAGVSMKGGLLIIKKASLRVGASMRGGHIVVEEIDEILPGFFYEGEERNPEIEGEVFDGEYKIYSGDHAERKAKGRLLVKKE